MEAMTNTCDSLVQEPTGKTRKTRVSKACNFCRKRKIKCDGSKPCSNCVHAENQRCEYPINCRKPRQRKPDSGKTVETLQRRMGNLETLLVRLTAKLDPHNEIDTSLLAQDDISDGSGTSDQEDSDSKMQLEDSKSVELAPEEKKIKVDPGASGGVKDAPKPRNKHDMEHYYGTHSLINIFSAKSIEWMSALLGPEDLEYVKPLQSLAMVAKMCKEPPHAAWPTYPNNSHEQLMRLQKGKPLEDPQLVYDLLDNYESVFWVNYLCDIKDIRAMLSHLLNPKGPIKRPNMPELLVANTALLLCLAREQEIRRQRHSSSHLNKRARPALDKLTRLDLQRLQDAYTNYALFYYSKVVLFYEGIVALQGILLLAMYVEAYWTSSKTNYIVIAVAVRLAQEMGLHRFESLELLPEEDANLRRRLWWFCQYFDMEICYRAGRPPIVNYLDVSTFSANDYAGLIAEVPKELVSCTEWSQLAEVIRAAPQHCIHQCTSHYLMRLTKIRARSYNLLYSASAERLSYMLIQESISLLNQDLVDLRDDVPTVIRPFFYDNPDFLSRHREVVLTLSDDSRDNFLTFQLTYFTHLMTINRIPFQIDYPDHDQSRPESINFRMLQTKSARTILHLVKHLDRATASPSCVKWLLYFPFVAFLNLIRTCLHRPLDPDTLLDLRLLIHVSMNFFSYFKHVEETLGMSRFETFTIEAATDGMVRMFLRIAVRYFDKVNSYNLVSEVDGLGEHLDAVTRMFPEMEDNKAAYRFVFGEDQLNSEAQSAKSASSTASMPETYGMDLNSKAFTNNFGPVFDGGMNAVFYEPSFSPMNNLPNFFFDNNL